MSRLIQLSAVMVVLLISAGATTAPDAANRPSEAPPPAHSSPVAAPTFDPALVSCLMSPAPTDLNEVSREGPLDPGTYSYCGVGRENLLNVRFTVPAGWEWHGSSLSKGPLGSRGDAAANSVEEARISFSTGDVQVYTDPCLWSESEPDPATGPAASDLIEALAAQPMRDASAPVERYAYHGGADTALPPSTGDPGLMGWKNGWEGLAIELTVPDDLDLADCDGGQFRSWEPDPSVRAHHGPGQRDVVWVVDTGERLVIDASWMPATPADVVTEIEDILESIATGHWG